MFKKLLIVSILFLAPSYAHALNETFYFSNSAGGHYPLGSNANPGTAVAPFNDFRGTTKDNPGALGCGDTIILDSGDNWTGSTAEIRLISNGCAGNPITLKGSGPTGKATLKGTTNYPSGWTNTGVNNTWYMSGISWTEFHFYIAMQSDTEVLMKFGSGYGNTLNTSCPGAAFTNVAIQNTCMPEGHFWIDYAADRVYVHLWRNENPNTIGTVSLPTFITGPSATGTRGIICTGCENGAYGDYVEIDMEHIEIIGAPGTGVSFGGAFNKMYDADQTDIDISGCGKDCIVHYNGQISGEDAPDGIVDGIITNGGSAAGTGHGQSWTTYAPRTLWVNSGCERSTMACTDHLQGFDATSNTSFSAVKNFNAVSCGQWGDRRGFDSCFYIDGGNNIVFKDFTGDNTLTGTIGSGAQNPRGVIRLGSEHPTTDPVFNISFVNGFIHTSHDQIIQTENIPSTTSNISGIELVHITAVGNRSASSTGFEQVMAFSNIAAIADTFRFENSILYGTNNAPINNYMTSETKYDFDHINYYRFGGNATIYRDSSTSTNWDLAAWQAASSEDGNSFYANPLFHNDTEGAFDVHLQSTATGHASSSPAIDAGRPNVWTCPSWLYSQWPTYFPECAPGQNPIQGSTRTDGVPDVGNPDLGYHYPTPTVSGPGTFTSATVTHASSVTLTNGTMTIQATNATLWPDDGKLILAVDPDYLFDSGGTTAAACTAGCDGTLTISAITSNTVYMTRGGVATDLPASTPFTVTLTNVRTPDVGQTANASILQTTTAGDSILDIKTDIPGAVFTTPAGDTQTWRISHGNFRLTPGIFLVHRET